MIRGERCSRWEALPDSVDMAPGCSPRGTYEGGSSYRAPRAAFAYGAGGGAATRVRGKEDGGRGIALQVRFSGDRRCISRNILRVGYDVPCAGEVGTEERGNLRGVACPITGAGMRNSIRGSD